ncbi:hypothetical protein BKA70DRAFT_509407 [Coprinopsis sp. MPI-PUGE-AT-0042]|nr:hypothetical protein BKA70DRAFT_509407 [Coprinopsis sp. MPI-PUGE-AT-0042]
MDVCEYYGHIGLLDSNPQSSQEVQDEIARIEAFMERLNQRRLELKRKANRLLPISHLPADILLVIFAHLCKHEAVSASTATKAESPTVTPLFLGSICAYWRSLLWNTPLAWRDLVVDVSFSRPYSQLQLLAEWLARAQQAPLHITLSAVCDGMDDMEAARVTGEVLEVLAIRSAYWERIDFHIPPRCHDTLLQYQFPRLASVRLRPPSGSITAFNPPPDMFINNTPSVIGVDLTGYDYSSMSLPWHQLQKFRAEFLSASQCVDVLRASPNLVELYLDKVFIPNRHQSLQPPVDDHNAPLIHEALKVLQVGFIREDAAEELLNALSLPALRELSVGFSGTKYWQSLLPLKTLAEASSLASRPWNLRTLKVVQNPLDEEGLVECLEALPGLVELDIQVAGIPTERLNSLDAMRNQLGGLSKKLVGSLGGSSEGESPQTLPLLRHFSYEGPVLCPLMDVAGALSLRANSGVGAVRLEMASIVARQSFTQAENLSREDEVHIVGLERHGIKIRQERNHKFW